LPAIGVGKPAMAPFSSGAVGGVVSFRGSFASRPESALVNNGVLLWAKVAAIPKVKPNPFPFIPLSLISARLSSHRLSLLPKS
jgi:hypothetical protein